MFLRWIKKIIGTIVFLVIISIIIFLIDKRIGEAIFGILWLFWIAFLQLFLKDVVTEIAVYILLALLFNGSVFFVSSKKEKYYWALASSIGSIIGYFVMFN